MKTITFKQIILFIIALLLYVIGFVGCTYQVVPTKQNDAYTAWKAEQAAILQRQLDYVNSPAFKAKYGGTSYGNDKNGVRAGSVVGTNADPFNIIRLPGMGVDNVNIGVRVYK